MRLLAVIVLMFAAACSSPAGTPIIIYVTPPPPTNAGATQAVVSALPNETIGVPPVSVGPPTTSPTATPRPTRTPQATSSVTMQEAQLRTWASNGYVTAQIIVPVVNEGGTWVQLDQFDSSYTIYAPDGSITATQDYFSGVVPEVIGPGETGYVVAEEFTDDFERSAFDTVDASVYYQEASEQEHLQTSNIQVRSGSFGGVDVTGEVTNPGDARVDSGSVVALFFDSAGEILGYALGSVENVEPGGKRAFEASSSFAEIRIADIADTLVLASRD